MEIDIKKVMSLDLYKILDIEDDASDSDIRKAYKKRALKCHPDKNPDNPEAAAEFVRLTEALEVLLDTAARKAYDNFLKAKKATEIRNRQLESKRKRLKEELEARENAALQKAAKEKSAVKEQQTKNAAKLLEQEIERLRKEGSRLVAEEQEKLEKQIREEASQLYNDGYTGVRLRVKWRSAKSDVTNGGYTADSLQHVFEKYGEVTALLVSKKKNGSAIVEFSTHDAAARAIRETGNIDNPLTLSWLSAPTVQNSSHSTSSASTQVSAAASSAPSEPSGSGAASVDFESLVLMRLRQAEERKRLNQQMAAEDD